MSPISPVARPAVTISSHAHAHTHTGTYLVVISVRDGVGLDSRLLHLEQDPDGQDGLAVLPAQLHQHPVAHLKPATEVSTPETSRQRLAHLKPAVEVSTPETSDRG